MTKRERLGEFQQLALFTVIRLGENAYGVKIRQDLAERTDRDISIGAVYTTLDRLEEKGFVTSRLGDPTPERGGRAKRYFRITASGERALQEARRAYEHVSGAIAPQT